MGFSRICGFLTIKKYHQKILFNMTCCAVQTKRTTPCSTDQADCIAECSQYSNKLVAYMQLY